MEDSVQGRPKRGSDKHLNFNQICKDSHYKSSCRNVFENKETRKKERYKNFGIKIRKTIISKRDNYVKKEEKNLRRLKKIHRKRTNFSK